MKLSQTLLEQLALEPGFTTSQIEGLAVIGVHYGRACHAVVEYREGAGSLSAVRSQMFLIVARAIAIVDRIDRELEATK